MLQDPGPGQSKRRITSRQAAQLCGIHPLKEKVTSLPPFNPQAEKEREDEVDTLAGGAKLLVWRGLPPTPNEPAPWHFLILGDKDIVARLVPGGNA